MLSSTSNRKGSLHVGQIPISSVYWFLQLLQIFNLSLNKRIEPKKENEVGEHYNLTESSKGLVLQLLLIGQKGYLQFEHLTLPFSSIISIVLTSLPHAGHTTATVGAAGNISNDLTGCIGFSECTSGFLKFMLSIETFTDRVYKP